MTREIPKMFKRLKNISSNKGSYEMLRMLIHRCVKYLRKDWAHSTFRSLFSTFAGNDLQLVKILIVCKQVRDRYGQQREAAGGSASLRRREHGGSAAGASCHLLVASASRPARASPKKGLEKDRTPGGNCSFDVSCYHRCIFFLSRMYWMLRFPSQGTQSSLLPLQMHCFFKLNDAGSKINCLISLLGSR